MTSYLSCPPLIQSHDPLPLVILLYYYDRKFEVICSLPKTALPKNKATRQTSPMPFSRSSFIIIKNHVENNNFSRYWVSPRCFKREDGSRWWHCTVGWGQLLYEWYRHWWNIGVIRSNKNQWAGGWRRHQSHHTLLVYLFWLSCHDGCGHCRCSCCCNSKLMIGCLWRDKQSLWSKLRCSRGHTHAPLVHLDDWQCLQKTAIRSVATVPVNYSVLNSPAPS